MFNVRQERFFLGGLIAGPLVAVIIVALGLWPWRANSKPPKWEDTLAVHSLHTALARDAKNLHPPISASEETLPAEPEDLSNELRRLPRRFRPTEHAGCEWILPARPAVRRRPTCSAERRNVFGREKRDSLFRDGRVEGSDLGRRHVESGAVPEQPEVVTASGQVGMGREREELTVRSRKSCADAMEPEERARLEKLDKPGGSEAEQICDGVKRRVTCSQYRLMGTALAGLQDYKITDNRTARRFRGQMSERRKNQKLGIRRKGLRLDATQPGAANTTMIERAGVASSFVDSRAGDRERRPGICPKEERTYSATPCI